MVVWESRCPSKVHPARGDQTERRAAARAADASTSGARGPNEREVHADPSRRTRAAELPPTSLRSATTSRVATRTPRPPASSTRTASYSRGESAASRAMTSLRACSCASSVFMSLRLLQEKSSDRWPWARPACRCRSRYRRPLRGPGRASMTTFAELVSTTGGSGSTSRLHPLAKGYCERRRFRMRKPARRTPRRRERRRSVGRRRWAKRFRRRRRTSPTPTGWTTRATATSGSAGAATLRARPAPATPVGRRRGRADQGPGDLQRRRPAV